MSAMSAMSALFSEFAFLLSKMTRFFRKKCALFFVRSRQCRRFLPAAPQVIARQWFTVFDFSFWTAQNVVQIGNFIS
jgi:hypothetical protein